MARLASPARLLLLQTLHGAGQGGLIYYSGWPVILLSKKDTSLGLFPYFLILLSFFGLKLVLNILLWLQNYET